MSILDAKHEKWFRKTVAGFRKAWVSMVSSAESFDAFCEGIAAVTGIPKGTVAASMPATNYKEFQANAAKYLPLAVAKIEAAYRAGKGTLQRKYLRHGRLNIEKPSEADLPLSL